MHVIIAENQRKNLSEYHNSAKEVQLNFDFQTKIDLSISQINSNANGGSGGSSKQERQDIDGQKLMVNFAKFSFEIKQNINNSTSSSSRSQNTGNTFSASNQIQLQHNMGQMISDPFSQ